MRRLIFNLVVLVLAGFLTREAVSAERHQPTSDCLVELEAIASPSSEARRTAYQEIIDSASPFLRYFHLPKEQRIREGALEPSYLIFEEVILFPEPGNLYWRNDMRHPLVHEFGHRIAKHNWNVQSPWERIIDQNLRTIAGLQNLKDGGGPSAMAHANKLLLETKILWSVQGRAEELFGDLLTASVTGDPDGVSDYIEYSNRFLAREAAALKIMEDWQRSLGALSRDPFQRRSLISFLRDSMAEKLGQLRLLSKRRKSPLSLADTSLLRRNSVELPRWRWKNNHTHQYLGPARTYFWNRHFASADDQRRALLMKAVFDSVQEWAASVADRVPPRRFLAETLPFVVRAGEEKLSDIVGKRLPKPARENRRLIRIFERRLRELDALLGP